MAVSIQARRSRDDEVSGDDGAKRGPLDREGG